jgi:V-type H+-transporting ATPase subunit a
MIPLPSSENSGTCSSQTCANCSHTDSPEGLTERVQLNPDVNPFQRSFVGEIRRIDEMARRVRFFSSQIAKEKDLVPIRPLEESAPLTATRRGATQIIDELDVTLAEHETRLLLMNESYQKLSERARELSEARHVLRETAVFFDKVCYQSCIVWTAY